MHAFLMIFVPMLIREAVKTRQRMIDRKRARIQANYERTAREAKERGR